MPTIYFDSYSQENFEINRLSDLVNWIEATICSFQKKCGEIRIVFCDDTSLLEMNQNYLHHNTYTDIITFNYNEAEKISGELYISIDRVGENAFKYKETLERELARVIIHGILHLIGFNDKTLQDKSLMRKQENAALRKAPTFSFMWNKQ